MDLDRSEVIRAGDLQILLNVLHDRREALTVRYPFFELDLFRYDPRKGVLTNAVGALAFEEARHRRLPRSEKLQGDLLTWEDLRDALVSSGALPHANHEEARKSLEWERENARRGNNPNPTFLAYDTNVFYHRVLRPDGATDLSRLSEAFQLVVSKGAREELSSACQAKYAPGEVQELARAVADPGRARGLLNRLHKKGRKARAGLADLQRLEKARRVVSTECEPLAGDPEENDTLIARSYAKFRAEVVTDVVLVTADNQMVAHAQAHRLKSCFLAVPPLDALPSGPLDERVLCRLVHDVAVAAGVLHFPRLDVRVWGEWSGKTPEEWASDSLRVEWERGTERVAEFLRDLRAVRAVEAAGLRE